MNRFEAAEKVNELLGGDLTQEFDAQDERAGTNGNMHFLVSNSKNNAVQVEMSYNQNEDETTYRINEEWAR